MKKRKSSFPHQKVRGKRCRHLPLPVSSRHWQTLASGVKRPSRALCQESEQVQDCSDTARAISSIIQLVPVPSVIRAYSAACTSGCSVHNSRRINKGSQLRGVSRALYCSTHGYGVEFSWSSTASDEYPPPLLLLLEPDLTSLPRATGIFMTSRNGKQEPLSEGLQVYSREKYSSLPPTGLLVLDLE